MVRLPTFVKIDMIKAGFDCNEYQKPTIKFRELKKEYKEAFYELKLM
jgi:hypothetical protein